MQGQDILILIKLISLRKNHASKKEDRLSISDKYTVRELANVLGVSKSSVNISINRSVNSGLAIYDRKTKLPKANAKALYEFIIYGLKYVFPVKPAKITRGIPTSFAAPVLSKNIMSTGDYIYVWPDAEGEEKGQSLAPLYKSVPFAIKQDLFLYEILALIDAIRIGGPREANIAKDLLSERLLNYDTDI